RDWCEKNEYDMYSDGLKIYLTIDSRMQQLAEEAVEKQMRNLQKKFFRHWKDKAPWVDEKDQEIPGFIEASMKRTAYYQHLKKQYNNDIAKINEVLNTPREMTVFTWDNDSLEKTVTMT